MSLALREAPTNGVRLGRVDRVLRAVAPGWAARREEARARLAQAEARQAALAAVKAQFSRGGYQGATKGAGYTEWDPGEGSADADILEDLHDLRARSRELVRNDPHAAGLINCWVGQIVGTGLWPQSRIDRERLGLSPEQAEAFQRAAERVYRRWARRVDAPGRLTAPEQQALVVRQILENGDVFLVPRMVAGRPYALSIETIEADRVTTPPGKAADDAVREGIRIGSLGEPQLYYIKRTHPGDVRAVRQDDFAEVPAFDRQSGRQNVHHLYRYDRPGQSRGVPMLAPAMTWFRDLKQYFQAELIGAKVSACFTAFIVQQDPLSSAERGSKPHGTQRLRTISPGTVEYLADGEDVKFASPNRPGGAFDAFTTRMIRAAGAPSNTPYELISQDFSKTTYTSGRMALTEVRRIYRCWQRWLAEKFCQPFYELLLEEAFLAGELPVDNFEEFREEYTRATWVGQGWAWVDPEKEVAATVEAINNNLTTLSEELASRGIDWEEALDQLARERGALSERGLSDPSEALKSLLDLYGVGVRAGVLTPQEEDEEALREKVGLPPVSDEVKRAWDEEGGVRRPITIQPNEEEPPGDGDAAPGEGGDDDESQEDEEDEADGDENEEGEDE